MKTNAWILLMTAAATFLLVSAIPAQAAILTLSGSSYSQNFDSIGGGLPTGWTVNTGASASADGTSGATFTSTATTWADNSGEFRNVASADGLTSTASQTTQNASTDRALGIRQTGNPGGFGDPGAAFVVRIDNTLGFSGFSLSLQAQMLSVQTRSTTWTFDYRLGDSGNFTSLGTYTDPGTFGSTTINFDSTALSVWDNQSQDVWFRVVAIGASSGSGSRDTFGIDDFSLTFTPVPEPTNIALGIFAAVLLAFSGARALGKKLKS